MKKELKILILEDNPSDAELMELELRKAQIDFISIIVETMQDFQKELKNFKPDLILSDYSLPQFTGLDALEIAKKKCPEIPFIIVTGTLDEETAIKCIRWGAWDYVLKDKLVHLGHAARNALKLKAEKGKKRLAEGALQENKQELNAIFNGARDGIALLDKTGKIMRINKYIVEIGGFTEEKIVGKRFSALKMFPLKSMSKMITIFSKLIKGQEISYEVEVKTKKGEKKIVEIHNSLLKKDGKVEEVIAILRDITERKQAEKAVEESEEKYRAIVENSHDAIYIYKGEKFLFINDKTCKLSGYNKEDLYEMIIWDLIHPDDRKRIKEYGRKRFAGKEVPDTYSARVIVKNGDVRNCEFSVRKIHYKNDFAVLGAIRDITQSKKAEEALRESEEKFRILYNNSPDMYVSVSPTDASILLCNETLLKKTGYSREEIIGFPIFKMYHEDCMVEAKKAFQQFVEKGVIHDKELILKRKDGSKIDVSLNVDAVRDEAGMIIYSISSWREITERKQAEMELRRSEEQFRNFAENTPGVVSIYEWYPDGHRKFIYQGPGLINIIGKKLADKVKKNPNEYFKLIHPEDIEALENASIKAIKSNKNFDFEYRLQLEDSSHKWILSRFSMFPKENGVIRWQGIIYDITQRKHAEEKEKEHHKNIELLSETAMQFVEFPQDKDIYTYIGEQLHKLVGKDSYIAVNSIDTDKKILTTRAVIGMGKLSEKVAGILGRHPVGITNNEFTIKTPVLSE